MGRLQRALTPISAAMFAVSLAASALAAPTQRSDGASVRIAVIGESNLRSNFIESLRDAARDEHLSIETVPRSDRDLGFTVIVAQETTIGSAAAAVIALDRNGDIAASVVRSGRLSGREALNACAKELVKQIKILA